jgi:hypothetical protein
VQAVVNITHPTQKSRWHILNSYDGIVECHFCGDYVIDFVPTNRGITCHKCVGVFVEIACNDLETALLEQRHRDLGRKRA